MMQQMPPMGMPIQIMPAPPIRHRQRKQELSTSAATKTGALIAGSVAGVRQLISTPIAYDLAFKIIKQQMPEILEKLSPAAAKSAVIAGIIIGGTVITAISAGIGALAGNVVASGYNHFIRKENSRPKYF
jgi:hypothetical protein